MGTQVSPKSTHGFNSTSVFFVYMVAQYVDSIWLHATNLVLLRARDMIFMDVFFFSFSCMSVSFLFLLPDRVGVDCVIVPQDVQTEQAHNQRVHCGH